MKKILAIALLFVSVNTMATEKPLASNMILKTVSADKSKLEMGLYRVANTKEIKVIVKQQNTETLSIKLINEAGQVLHTETTNSKGASLVKFDFSDIKDGKYSIEVTNGEDKITKEIVISSAKAETIINLNI